MATGKTITIGSGGFIAGTLALYNFNQIGTTSQSLTLTGNSKLYIDNCKWNGSASFTAPDFDLNESIFKTTTITKTGSSTTNIKGKCQFIGKVTFSNTGTGDMYIETNGGNNYDGDCEINRGSSAGDIHLSYNSTSRISGNLILGSSASSITLAESTNGWVVMDGSSAQSISVTTSTSVTINRLRTDNSSSEVTLSTPVTVSSNLDLQNGNIITTSTNLLTLGDDAVVDNVSDNAFVSGPVKKIGNDAFVFPVGGTKSGTNYYQGIGISAPSNTTDAFTAQYHATGYSDVSNYNLPLEGVSQNEYWELDRTTGTSNVNVTLYWEDGSRCGIPAIGDITIAHYNGSAWDDLGQDSYTGNYQAGSITVTGVSSFSPFAFGTLDEDNSNLPISLVEFSINQIFGSVAVSWTTASEEETDYFEVEKWSGNNSESQIVGVVSAAGQSNVIKHYNLTDDNPYPGTSYYRLVEVDINGDCKKFDWKEVYFDNIISGSINIYPNPSVSNDINLKFENISGDYELEITDISGKVVYNASVYIDDKTNFRPDISLKKGVYFVRI